MRAAAEDCTTVGVRLSLYGPAATRDGVLLLARWMEALILVTGSRAAAEMAATCERFAGEVRPTLWHL